jgi:putative phosphotransacetylase
LTIPGQFACYEMVEVVGPKGRVGGAVVVGPPRSRTQVEVSLGNALVLGLEVPVRESGRLESTPGATLVGPAGQVELPSGVIAAARHIHMHPHNARDYGVANGQRVRVRVPGPRGLVFEQVVVDFQLVELLR